MSFALCSLLTQGLIDAFTLVGTEEEKKHIFQSSIPEPGQAL